MANSQFDLTRAPVAQLIRKVAFPASTGFLFSTMFNMADTWFAGKLSTDALAALGLSLSVFFAIIAIGSGLSTGANAVMGEAWGRGEREHTGLLAVQGVMLGLMAGVLLAAFGVWASPFMFRSMGAEGEYLRICLDYMTPIFLASPVFILSHMFNAALQTLGDTRSFRNTLAAGAVINLALDPWFMWGGFGLPAMGITGIALSTVVIQFMAMLYLLWKARRTGLLATNRGRHLIPRPAMFAKILKQGFPATFTLVTICLGFYVILYFIAKFGEGSVAAYGIAVRLEQIALLPSIGLGIAVLTITAQNFGACKFERIAETLNSSLKIGALLTVVGVAAILIMPEFLMGLFTDDPAVIQAGGDYLIITALTLYAYVIVFTCQSCLQGMQYPMYPMILGVVRQVAVPMTVFPILTDAMELGLVSLWWALFAIVWISAGVSYFYCRFVLNKLMSKVTQES